jgi:hypothetical protein
METQIWAAEAVKRAGLVLRASIAFVLDFPGAFDLPIFDHVRVQLSTAHVLTKSQLECETPAQAGWSTRVTFLRRP